MGCNNFLTEEDDRLLAESEGKACQLDPEIQAQIERDMPAVERAIAERCVECLEENVENSRSELREKLAQNEPTDIQMLDLVAEPTEREYWEMYETGKELGMTKDLEIIDMPTITGIKDPEEVITQEEIKNKIQAGEVKLGEVDQIINQIEQRTQKNHIDTETMRSLMKETFSFLQNSKIPYKWRDQATVNMVVFVDKQESANRPGYIAPEKVSPPDLLQAVPERSKNLYLFRNKEGRLLPKTDEERKDFQWKIAHGICHINDVQWGRVDERIIGPDGAEAFRAQLNSAPVSDYAEEAIKECKGDFDKILGHPELRAELFAAWVTDSPKLCPETKEFFNKNFSE